MPFGSVVRVAPVLATSVTVRTPRASDVAKYRPTSCTRRPATSDGHSLVPVCVEESAGGVFRAALGCANECRLDLARYGHLVDLTRTVATCVPDASRAGRQLRADATLGGMNRRRLGVLLALASIPVVAGCGASTTQHGQSARTSSVGQAPTASATASAAGVPGILRRPRTSADNLPRWISSNPTLKIWDAVPSTARFALRTPGHRYWVTRGFYQGRPATCLIDALARDPGAAYRPRRPGGVNCQPSGVFTLEFIVANMSYPPVTTQTLSGVVPDGYTQVHFDGQAAPVVNNVFEITGPAGESVTTTGPAGSRTVWFEQSVTGNPPSVSAVLPLRLFSARPTPAAHLPASVRSRLEHHQHA
jgi:hypothetical protein